MQDAAYGTLLREPRRALHARIADAIESRFADVAESQPELLARHCTEAGLIDKAAGLWGKAGQIVTLPTTSALRREQIKLQVALITPLIHLKGYAAPEPKAAAERACLLIEQAEALKHSGSLPKIRWLTEGFDTPVLQDAKALLDQLA